MIKRLFHSLNTRLLLTLLGSALCGLVVFAAVRAGGNFFIDKYYMSAEAISARRLGIYNEFKSYVLANDVASWDTARIGAWSRGQTYVTLIVYGDQMRVEAGRWGASGSNATNYMLNNSAEVLRPGSYFLRFSDGVYAVTISENSETREYTLCTILSVSFAFVAAIAVLLYFAHRLTGRIAALARTAQEVGRGNLEQEIAVKGQDELALLGREMDGMRRSLVRRIDAEHEARQANSSLITAISHDLRTPMTSMIGYLELLQNKGYADEEQREHFLASAHGKAMELKELTDELFKYFLVFGGERLPMSPEVYDAEILLDQLLGEPIIELREAGFRVHVMRLNTPCRIRVDVLHLKRVFDNLISNLRKYADPDKPSVIRGEIAAGELSVCVSNSKGSAVGRVESSKIGLRTCEKIVEQMGGRFLISEDETHFSAEVILPLYLG